MPYKDPEELAEYRRANRAKYHESRHKGYRDTAFRPGGRRQWTAAEDEQVLAHEIPDRELVDKINRSMGAIHVRRCRLLAAIDADKEVSP